MLISYIATKILAIAYNNCDSKLIVGIKFDDIISPNPNYIIKEGEILKGFYYLLSKNFIDSKSSAGTNHINVILTAMGIDFIEERHQDLITQQPH